MVLRPHQHGGQCVQQRRVEPNAGLAVLHAHVAPEAQAQRQRGFHFLRGFGTGEAVADEHALDQRVLVGRKAVRVVGEGFADGSARRPAAQKIARRARRNRPPGGDERFERFHGERVDHAGAGRFRAEGGEAARPFGFPDAAGRFVRPGRVAKVDIPLHMNSVFPSVMMQKGMTRFLL